MTSDRTTSYVGLGATLATLGRGAEARDAFEEAAALLSEKGAVRGVDYVQRLIAEL